METGSLPVKAEGIGVRSVMFIAPSHSCHRQQALNNCKLYCSKTNTHGNCLISILLMSWMTGANVITLYTLPMVLILVSNVLGTCHRLMQLFILFADDYHIARLTAVNASHSGDWLNTLYTQHVMWSSHKRL